MTIESVARPGSVAAANLITAADGIVALADQFAARPDLVNADRLCSGITAALHTARRIRHEIAIASTRQAETH